MDKVEPLFEDPWLVGVIDYEAGVWWDTIMSWLTKKWEFIQNYLKVTNKVG